MCTVCWKINKFCTLLIKHKSLGKIILFNIIFERECKNSVERIRSLQLGLKQEENTNSV
jgi:hypothetical protein